MVRVSVILVAAVDSKRNLNDIDKFSLIQDCCFRRELIYILSWREEYDSVTLYADRMLM